MCAADGRRPSLAFLRYGHSAVACLNTAIAAGVAFLTIGFIAVLPYVAQTFLLVLLVLLLNQLCFLAFPLT